MDEFEHDLLHLVSSMIQSLQEWETKICELIDKKYKNSAKKEKNNGDA